VEFKKGCRWKDDHKSMDEEKEENLRSNENARTRTKTVCKSRKRRTLTLHGNWQNTNGFGLRTGLRSKR